MNIRSVIPHRIKNLVPMKKIFADKPTEEKISLSVLHKDGNLFLSIKS